MLRQIPSLTTAWMPPLRGDAGAKRRFRRWLVGGLVVTAVVLATHGSAEASHCGSYVIANPSGRTQQLGRPTVSHSTAKVDAPNGPRGGVPHVPTPCEKGHCRDSAPIPLAPSSLPSLRPAPDNLLLQIASSLDLGGKRYSRFIAQSACPRTGFYRQLEHPPDSLHF